MIQLLIFDDSKTSIPEETGFSGFPVIGISETLEWPQCRTCGSELQFLGKIEVDLGIEMTFSFQLSVMHLLSKIFRNITMDTNNL